MFRLLHLRILTLNRADIVQSRRQMVQRGWLLRLPQWCLLAVYFKKKKMDSVFNHYYAKQSVATVELMHFYFLYLTCLLWRLICWDGFRGRINAASPLEDCFPQSQGLKAFRDTTSFHKEIHKHMQQNTVKLKIPQNRAPYWPLTKPCPL